MGAGTFNWRALATQTAAESVSGLGESPYFPTLRGARKKHTPGAEGGSAGVSSPTFQLKVNNATADQGKGKQQTGAAGTSAQHIAVALKASSTSALKGATLFNLLWCMPECFA